MAIVVSTTTNVMPRSSDIFNFVSNNFNLRPRIVPNYRPWFRRSAVEFMVKVLKPPNCVSLLLVSTVTETATFWTLLRFDDSNPLHPAGTPVATQYGAGAVPDVCWG
jgi:hypothetical protein